MKFSLELAEAAIEKAKMKALEINAPVSITVVDSGGYLKAFARMDGALLGSIDIALKKAKTSILFAMNSESVWEFCKPGAPAQGLSATNDVIVTFAGGIPFKDVAGDVVGAIGVSGGSVDQDYAVAIAGSLIMKKGG